jgi:hypothetical protein
VKMDRETFEHTRDVLIRLDADVDAQLNHFEWVDDAEFGSQERLEAALLL